LCATLLALLFAASVQAEKKQHTSIQPGSCPIEPADAHAIPNSAFTDEDASDGLVHIVGDEADARLGEELTFRGNVELLRSDLRLFADEATYNQRRNRVNASGRLLFQRDSGESFRAPTLQYELDTDRASGETVAFSSLDPKVRGEARHFFLDGRNTLNFRSVRFTTCPQGQDDWFLRTSRLTLDKNTETGNARHVVFEFSLFGLPHVPLFYTPYLSFPLTEARRSGFLSPHVGDNNKAGFYAAIPYYFNLAPNYDLTLTPRYMSQRGVLWSNDFRYLGQGLNGRLGLDYLPQDQTMDEDRQKLVFHHNQRLSPTWSMNTDIEWVSDNFYFLDLGSTAGLTETNRTHLPHSVRFDYGGEIWRFMAHASTFQTIDSNITLADQPYQRLPQMALSANAPGGPNRPSYNFYSEWVYFYRAGQTGAAIPPPDWVYSPYGHRLDIYPSVSLPLRTTYLYFTPKVGYRYTAWNLQHHEQGQSIGTTIIALPDATPERGLPIYSLDSGLVLERPSIWGNTRLTQTLEPRIFYVNIPYRDQDHLPIFDTAVPDFSFYNFFRENRFVGADRVGDANQITAAITTRFLGEETGVEHLRLSIGQVKYFDDQRVNWPVLPAGTGQPTTSDLIGELFARLSEPWYLRSAVQWDDKNSETRKSNFYITYRPAADRTINFGIRYLDTPPTAVDRQFDVSGQWPLTSHWAGFARWNYSLEAEHSIFALAGLEYSHCCWGVRLSARHRILADGTKDNTVQFQMMLGGISTSYDQNPDSPLKINRFMFD
jgi:LPS-assembly protein